MINLNDHPPPHVHVISGDKHAIVSIERTPTARRNDGFSEPELGDILDEIGDRFDLLMEQWSLIHGGQGGH